MVILNGLRFRTVADKVLAILVFHLIYRAGSRILDARGEWHSRIKSSVEHETWGNIVPSSTRAHWRACKVVYVGQNR